MSVEKEILDLIVEERNYQKSKVIDDKSMDEFDMENTQADWIAYINRYACGVHPKLEWSKDDRTFEEAMVKVAALAVAAIENHRKGYC